MAWQSVSGPPLTEGEDELSLKLEYASYRTQGKSSREAAYAVFRHDVDEKGMRYFGRALQAMSWESDPIVQEEIERQREPGEVEGLHPTPEQLDLEVLEFARSALDAKVRLGAYELYANLRGRSTKAAAVTNVNVDNRRTVNVLSVPQKMTVEEAQAAFAKRQAQKTIAHARPVSA